MTERQQQPGQRRIRSFVKRTGRMTLGQEKAFESCWQSFGLNLDDGVLDVEQTFGRAAPLVLEIGFGMGASLVQMAAQSPQTDFIGIEVHKPGVGKLFHLMQEQGVNNIRAYCDDAVDVLNRCIGDESLQRVQIYFPDPWHKKKHHKRRLIQPQFVQLLRSKLQPGGTLHLATDWEHYAEHMMEVLSAAAGFRNCEADFCFSPRPGFRPETKFERRGQRLGHGVWDLLFEKVG